MPSPSASSRTIAGRIAALCAVCVAYAVVRYNVFAGVAWSEAPLFVANKGVSLAAIVLLASSYLVHRLPLGPGQSREARGFIARGMGLSGFALSIAHAIVSLLVFTEARYPRLMASGELTSAGLLSLVLGAVAIPFFAAPALYSFEDLIRMLGASNWKRAQQLGYLGLLATSVHILAIGSANWFDPTRWPGGFPPISLLSFLVCAAPLAAKARATKVACSGAEPELS